MPSVHDHRVAEVTSETAARLAVRLVREALDSFDANQVTLGELLDTLALAGGEAGRVRLRGWPIFEQKADAA